jgi:hypothetical protein
MNTNLLNLSCDASKALAEIWMSRLEIIRDATGIDMSVLLKCVDMQIPTLPKKRAPPAKKNTDEEKEQAIAKKAAEALAKKEQALAKKEQALAKKEQAIAKKAAEALAKKEQALAKKEQALAMKEQQALAKKKKNAPKTKPTVKANEEPRQEELKPAKFKYNDKVVYIRPSGVEVDSMVEYVLQYTDRVEYRLQVIGTNETILAAEESVRENCDDDDESECSKTVMMSEDRVREAEEEEEECQLVKRSEIFLANGQQQIQAERIIMNGVAYLIGNNDIAYLESSKRMVGKYDYEDQSIRQLYSSEYDEYYGKSESEESDEDECPVISDMSDSESESESD